MRVAAYKAAHGDCSVPQGWAEDPPLARWVAHQRQGKKKLDCGEPSKGMTVARVAELDKLGFNWAAPKGFPHGGRKMSPAKKPVVKKTIAKKPAAAKKSLAKKGDACVRKR